ncbi:MAG: DUF1877 family protein [Myxococcota bacterium]
MPRGVLFALDDAQSARLAAAAGDAAVRDCIAAIEERWERAWLFQTDKAWDAIHRALTDGRLLYENGAFPLSHCILGGFQLHAEDDWVVSVTAEEHVADVARALADVTEEVLREGYARIDADDYPDKSDADFAYTWASFRGLPEFYGKAAEAGRPVVFTVDL